jgi:hypothetical protein
MGATPGLNDTRDNRGIVLCIGDSTSAFVKFHVDGVDTLPLGGGNVYAIRFDNTALANVRTLVGTPGTSPQTIGGGLNTTDTVRGVNLGVDAARVGTGYDVLNGTGADPEASFAGVASDDESTSEGLFQTADGGYAWQGKLRIGSASTACEFLDSNVLLAIKDTPHSLVDFTEMIIENAASIVTLNNVTFLGLGTNNRGRLEVLTSAATLAYTSCIFQDFGVTILGTGSTMDSCSWIGADVITANGADLSGSTISGFEGTADTSPVIWDVATDPDGKLDDMSVTKGTAATHAFEFGLNSPTTMTLRGVDFAGYNAANGQDDSTFHVKRTSSSVTINIVGGSGNVSYRTDGATVSIVQNPVSLDLNVIDIVSGSEIQNARAYIEADSVGPLPYQDSVTITRVTTTATVAHTAHGLSNGEKVFIAGADQDEYNGVQTISNVSTNAYDYTVSGSPTTPATGTITSTAVIIEGLTDINGDISNTRTYTANQDFTGRVRMSSAPPYYKTSKVTGTIDSNNGATVTVGMIKDE